MRNVKVSIIVPIYNVEKYLDRCMTSLLGQTLQDIEIIMVDDESPDCCPKICDSYASKDNRVKVIHKKNGGLGYARNSGLDVAEGEFVAFIDSDDFVELDMMERLYKELSENHLDAIYTEFNTEDYPGIESPDYGHHIFNSKRDIEKLRLDIVGSEPSFKSCSKFQSSACKGLYSLDIIKKHGVKFYSEREYISEDMLFNLDFLKYANKVETVTWRFYHYCLNGASLSHTYRKDRWNKQLSLLKHLASRANEFTNVYDFQLRIGKTALAYSKIAIAQEIKRKATLTNKIQSIKTIITTTEFLSLLMDYPIYSLPLKWRVYAILVRFRFSFLIYLLLR